VRYEDLVANPDAQAARIFSFLGEDSLPEVAQSCFAADREQFGPSDPKIWATSGIIRDSVGRV
jgi:hypothetical protein